MTATHPDHHRDGVQIVRTLNIAAKALLMLMLVLALMSPDLGNMRDKAAVPRAVAYPLLSFALPAIWLLFLRHRGPFPWFADLLITITCFTDILGNRMDLYDSISWFDDWMHFMNNGLLVAAFILLTMRPGAPFVALLERALAFGVTAAVTWEVAEYFAFLSDSTEKSGAYADTLGDLTMGTLGSIVAAIVISRAWRRSKLNNETPLLIPLHD